jgi:hypothetical protein
MESLESRRKQDALDLCPAFILAVSSIRPAFDVQIPLDPCGNIWGIVKVEFPTIAIVFDDRLEGTRVARVNCHTVGPLEHVPGVTVEVTLQQNLERMLPVWFRGEVAHVATVSANTGRGDVLAGLGAVAVGTGWIGFANGLFAVAFLQGIDDGDGVALGVGVHEGITL